MGTGCGTSKLSDTEATGRVAAGTLPLVLATAGAAGEEEGDGEGAACPASLPGISVTVYVAPLKSRVPSTLAVSPRSWMNF